MSAQKPQGQYVMVGNINTRFGAAGDKGTAVILLHLLECHRFARSFTFIPRVVGFMPKIFCPDACLS